MTRKYRIKRRKNISKMKRKGHRKTMKGGAHMIVKEAGGSLLKGLLTMFQYGFVSIVTAPIYLVALLANWPLNTPNNISGKRLNEVKSGVIHNQLYKYLFYGYNTKDLKQSDYNFPAGRHYTLQGNKVFVECDDCKRKKPEENVPAPGDEAEPEEKLRGGAIDVKKDMKKVLGVSGFSDVLGLLDKKEKMQSILMNFFDYLNNLQMKDVERRDLIHKLISNIHNKDAIIKCLIIFNTIFNDNECENMKKEIDLANRPDSEGTYMERPTIARIPNPFMIPGQEKIDLKKSIKCITGHLMYKQFGPETMTEDCLPKCPKCTLRTSIGRLASTYGSSITQLLKGNNKDLDLLSEIFYNIFKDNYSYSGTDNNAKMDQIKKSFITSLKNLPEYKYFSEWRMYPKNADMNIIRSIIVDTKFNVNNDSELNQIMKGSISNEDDKKNIFNKIYGEDVLNKFKILLCRYNIIDELKKRYVSLSFENYYSLSENVIKYPKDPNHKKTYIDWCNKFLDQLFTIHGIDSQKVDPKFLFGEKELNELVLSANTPLVNAYKQQKTN